MKIKLLTLAALAAVVSCAPVRSIDLSGEWQVSLDSLETFQPMSLPGTTDLAGLGEPNTLEPAVAVPQLERLTRKHSFLGAAYYKRSFELPESMADKPLELTLERVIWQSAVWIDGERVAGAEESLTTPHRHVIEKGLPAGTHEIMLRIDNRKRYEISQKNLAHAYTNDTQIIWNGVLGRLTLDVLDPVEVACVDVYPDINKKSAEVVTTLVRRDPKVTLVPLKVGGVLQMVDLKDDVTKVTTTYQLPESAGLWDEFSPELQTLTVACGNSEREVTFGLREIRVDGRDIMINGRKVFLRGTLDCCIFPLTGTPPTDDAGWEKVFGTCREWGLNHVRFHSWCPPEAAFRVADKMGFYLQVELPTWTKSLDRKDVQTYLTAEYDRIVREYGNHPSFCMMSCGNEHDRAYGYLNSLLRHMKETDPRHIYTNATYSMGAGHKGYPEPEDEYMVTTRTYLGQVRGQEYLNREEPDFTHDFSPAMAGYDLPMISHEVGQYSVYPRLSEIDKYTGVLEPLNFMAVRNVLQEKGLIDKAEDYTMASGRLAALLYKEECERILKTPDLSGYQLLGLQDFSGQCTALVGLLDAFWDDKGLVSSKWFRQCCAPVVPLARFCKPCWSASEEFIATVEIANYSASDIDSDVRWSLRSGSATLDSGICRISAPTGANTPLADTIRVALAPVTKPSCFTLTVELPGTQAKNSWNVWVYPETEPNAGDVVIARTLGAALPALAKGHKVLLNPSPDKVRGEAGKFVPVFWSPVWFPHEAGTMGVLCDPSHPALASFPTEMHSDWQWWQLTKHSKAMDLDAMPEAASIVEAIDNFTLNRRLAYAFEARCGEGSLLFCAMDLSLDKPEVQQMLCSMLDYMNSDKFAPSGTVGADELRQLFL